MSYGVQNSMSKPRLGQGVIVGRNVHFGEKVTIWNYVVIGDNTRIDDGTLVGSFCDIGKEVMIGRNCNIQAHVTISNGCKIGDNVFIAPNTSLLNDRYPKSVLLTPPTIGDDAVIGGGVTILPGVLIGKKAVVAGGSVVTKDVLPSMVVKGVPAKVAMTLVEYEAKRKNYVRSRKQVEK
jgi:UDP-2-acetamido-3-amino-2,3-dideoxy-glucuronate N-acetyltransferase